MGDQLFGEKDRRWDRPVDADAHTFATDAGTGKRTLAEHQPTAGDPDALLRSLAAEKRVIRDKGGYLFELTDEPAFVLLHAPNGRGEGAVFHRDHKAWPRLVKLALEQLAQASEPAPASQPAPASRPAQATQPVAATAIDQSDIDAATKAATDGGKAMKEGSYGNSTVNEETGRRTAFAGGLDVPFAVGDVGYWAFPAALRDPEHAWKPLKTKPPAKCWVRVLAISGQYLELEQLANDSAPSGTHVGWTKFDARQLKRSPRPARPSSPGVQMAALLAAARAMATVSAGRCFAAVKNAIVVAGGYGDILDFNNDHRIDRASVFTGPQLHKAIQAYGADRLGLALVTGAVANAKPGTILITQGNGKIKISEEYGDIAVIEGPIVGKKGQRRDIVAYNDGRMVLGNAVDPKQWQSGGRYENVLIAMYEPIARK